MNRRICFRCTRFIFWEVMSKETPDHGKLYRHFRAWLRRKIVHHPAPRRTTPEKSHRHRWYFFQVQSPKKGMGMVPNPSRAEHQRLRGSV